MQRKKIMAVVGARPQFIKHAPIEIACHQHSSLELITVHTGQHYDENMSKVFFDQLGMKAPDYMMNIGSQSHAKQTGRMMEKIEDIVFSENPDAVLVYGDTNSTLAGALVASKCHKKVIHIEAGLRSFNRSMPEEINRVLTDHVSDLLFAPTEQAVKNLRQEGINKGVYKTGDIMYDMILIAEEKGILKEPRMTGSYYLATIHRPYNTDEPRRLEKVLSALNRLELPVVFPMHPRTKNNLDRFQLDRANFDNILIQDPVSYFENINLMAHAQAIITDSGGMQKEAYFLKKKCITIRPETEWLETLEQGWNILLYNDLTFLQDHISKETGMHNDQLYGNGRSRYEICDIIETVIMG